MKLSQTPILSIDAVVMHGKSFVLIKRKKFPFQDRWCLPGGKVEYGETVERALKREMLEEIGIKVKPLKIIGIYSEPSRDPRWHSVSIAFLCKALSKKLHAASDCAEAKWFFKIPEKMGFDHKKILMDALKMGEKV